MYALKHHKFLTLEKWSGYSRGQQILMIANELNRAGNLLNQDMLDEVNNCYERALELADLTTSDNKWKGRSRELRRFREVLASLYADETGRVELNKRIYDALIRMHTEAYNQIG